MSSEYDRQMKIFNAKIKNPDLIIYASSVIKAESPEGDRYWFLTDDDEIVLVDCVTEVPDPPDRIQPDGGAEG